MSGLWYLVPVFYRTFLCLTLAMPCLATDHELGVKRSGFFIDKASVPVLVCRENGVRSHATLTSSYGGRVVCVVGAIVAFGAINGINNALLAPPAQNVPFTIAASAGAIFGTLVYALIASDQQHPKIFFSEKGPGDYGINVAYGESGISGPLLRVLRGARPAIDVHGDLVPGRLESIFLYGAKKKKRFLPEDHFVVDDAVVVVSDGEHLHEIPVRELQFLESCGARLLRWYRAFW